MVMRALGMGGACLLIALAGIVLIRAICGPTPSVHVAALLPDHNCGMACWNGIQPGVTDYKAARAAITERPDIVETESGDVWQFKPDDEHTHTARLEQGARPTHTGKIFLYPDGVRLGDLLLALGEPEFLVVRFEIEARQFQGTRYIELYHPDYRMSVTVLLAAGERLSARTPVHSVEYFSETMDRPVYAQSWRGFVTAIQPVYSLDEG